MLMLCWFYCVPFAKMLYYASGPLLVLFGAFALRRGITRSRPGLRRLAFILFFVASAKMWVFDLRDLDQFVVCGHSGLASVFLCSSLGFKIIGIIGILGLCATSFILFNFYARTLHNTRPRLQSPEDAGIRRWANVAMTVVLLLIVWSLAPWVGSLTVGAVPTFFTALPWQWLSLVCVVMLLIGFWKAEACDWTAPARRKASQQTIGMRNASIATAGWTPRDTLWMAVFLYLAAVALAYVAEDVLGG